MSDDDVSYFKLKAGNEGSYRVMSQDKDTAYYFKPNKIVEVKSYDVAKVRGCAYTVETDENGMPLPEDDSKRPAEAVITSQDLQPGAQEETDKDKPEESPDPPEEEDEEIEPNVIEVETDDMVEVDNEVNLEDKDRGHLIKRATNLDYYEETGENPAQAKNDELIEYIKENS